MEDWTSEEREAWHRYWAARFTFEASKQRLAALAVRTAESFRRLARALEVADAPYQAEVAVAHFEGRVPPSREVWEAEALA
jgi:hypothetical protein